MRKKIKNKKVNKKVLKSPKKSNGSTKKAPKEKAKPSKKKVESKPTKVYKKRGRPNKTEELKMVVEDLKMEPPKTPDDYAPTQREQLIHQWKCAMGRGDLGEAGLIKRKLELK